MGNAGWAGTVTEDDYARSWGLGGVGDVVQDDAAWKVVAGTGRQVAVNTTGFAFARGVISDGLGTLTVNLPTPTNGQFYLIVRRINWAAKTVTVVAVAHSTTTTSTPATPPSTFPIINGTAGDLYDHILGWAWVNSVNTTVKVWDLRLQRLTDRFTGMIDPRRLPGVSEAAVSLDALYAVRTDTFPLRTMSVNGRVDLEGAVTNKSAINNYAAGTTYSIGTVASTHRPTRDVYGFARFFVGASFSTTANVVVTETGAILMVLTGGVTAIPAGSLTIAPVVPSWPDPAA